MHFPADQNTRIFDELVVRMSTMLFGSDPGDLDSIIDESLQRIGEFAGADRAYVFRYDAALATMNNTNEWCAPGINAEKDNLQNLPLSLFPKWTAVLFSGECIHAPAVADMGDGWEAEKEILAVQQVRSVFAVPIAADGTQYGFMGFDGVRARIEWREEVRRMLGVFAHTLAVVWGRHRRELAMQLALAQAQQAAATAEQADRAKTDFLSMMSHEIRTPLNGVIGMARLLLGTALDEQQKRYADLLKASGDHLLAIISQILEYSKLEAGRLKIDSIPFDPGKSLLDLLEVFRVQAYDKGIDFDVAIDHLVPAKVRGDPTRLVQIVGNIVGNALKFTERGAVRVHVAVRRWGSGFCELSIAVRDTGLGIPEDFLPRLFIPFEQAEDTMSRKFGGSGLGLTIADRLCRLMGGSIEVASTPGAGSVFTVVLPFEAEIADTETAAESSGAEALAAYEGNRRRVEAAAVAKAGALAGCEEIGEGGSDMELCFGLDAELRERLTALRGALTDQEPELCERLLAGLGIISKELRPEAEIAEIAALASAFRFPEARARVDALLGAPA